jgi:PIN domain nuclease of toxin-antitoxin system
VRLLLDTHLLLWAAIDPDRLPSAARTLIGLDETEPVFSSISILEIAIKRALNRSDFAIDPGPLRRGLLDNGYTELPVDGRHAQTVASLPAEHKDPFDRVLIAQATVEGMTLLTVDKMLGRYPGPIWVL